MPTDIVIKRCLEEAERRVDAMQVLCDLLTGQLKGERCQIDAIKAALVSDNGEAVQGEISPEMLG